MQARHARPGRLPRHLARAAWLAVVPLALSVCATFQSASPAVASVTCPSGVTSLRTGNQSAGLNATNNNGTWMLQGAVWNENAPSPIKYPVRSDAWTKGCIVGGTVLGSVPKTWTRDQWYDGVDGGVRMGGEAFRQTMTNTPDNFLRIQDAFVEDYEDAFDPNSPLRSSTTYLDHVTASYIRDDCVENEDAPHNLVITNSLLDGCFTAFAERPSGSSSATNGTGPQSFTVLSSLVYVNPQPLGPRYCDSSRVSLGRCATTATPGVWMGSYGIWKWSDQAASRVTVKDTVFRLDMPSYSSCQSQKWPAGTYENVTLVWTGSGSYATAGGCKNVLPAGVRLTTDVGVWNAAKAAWAAR